MFHCKVANATWILLCKYSRWKLENMNNEPKNTHISYVQTRLVEFHSWILINDTPNKFRCLINVNNWIMHVYVNEFHLYYTA